MDLVDLYNRALNAVGTRSRVSSPTESSREAETCALWYEGVRDQILRAARWPATRATSRLALLAERDDTLAWETGDPEPGFLYAYALPSDFLYPRHLTTFNRFVMGSNGSQRVLYTQDEDALLIYTKREENISLWDPEMQMAVVYALAAHISMPLHGKAGRAKFAMEQANELILQARLSAANEDVNQYDSVPDWISMRGYSGSAPSQRYLYPYGPMISVPEMSAVT